MNLHDRKRITENGPSGTRLRVEEKSDSDGSSLVVDILGGNKYVIERYFLRMLRKGWFKRIREYYGDNLDIFMDDLCGEVALALFEKCGNGELDKIRHPKSFTWAVIKNVAIR